MASSNTSLDGKGGGGALNSGLHQIKGLRSGMNFCFSPDMFGIEHAQKISAMVRRKQPKLRIHAALLSSGPGACQYGDMISVRKEDLPSITVLKGG